MDHVVRLTDDWALWRWTVLRGAGFPASLALRLALPNLAQTVDQQLEAEREAEVAREQLVEALRRAPSATPAAAEALRRARKAIRKNRLPAPEDVPGVADAEREAYRCAL